MPTTIDTPPLMDTRAAARFLGVSERALHRLKASGSIPFVPVGRLIRYRPESLAAWAETQEQKIAPPPSGR